MQVLHHVPGTSRHHALATVPAFETLRLESPAWVKGGVNSSVIKSTAQSLESHNFCFQSESK